MGGFRALDYDRDAEFASALGPNGTVKWSRQQLEHIEQSAIASKAWLTIRFSEVDWPFLQSIYGWAAVQFQAWARGTLTLNYQKSECIVIYTDNVLEFYIDGKSYFGGDFYSYRRAPLVVCLEPGRHRFDVRLIRDVRVMGGLEKATIQVRIEAYISQSLLTVVKDKSVIPDIIDGKLGSNLASVPVRNEGSSWVHIVGLESADVRILDAQEAGRLLMPLWRTVFLLLRLRRVLAVLLLGKQDLSLSLFPCVVLRPVIFLLRSSIQLATTMGNAILQSPL